MNIEQTDLLLEYQKQILTEIVEEDGLLVISRGLGLRIIICSLLKIYSQRKNLVILLNTPSKEELSIKEELAQIGISKPGLRIVNNEMSAKERILIVDLLTKKIPTHLITGIFVNHAERINVTSTEAFILRIFRQENKEGFIKAFSDSPETFVSGFSPLQTTLQLLQLRKAFLWPRFHVLVRECLEEKNFQVIELQQSLSESMFDIQSAILECIGACISEVRKSTSSIDFEEFTIENALFKSFDIIIRQQLDPVWHRVSMKTKQLVNDLKTLRKLLTYLVSYDCVSFNIFLETILASQAPTSSLDTEQQSPWIFLDAGETIFSMAKKRVFIRNKPTSKISEKTNSVIEITEESTEESTTTTTKELLEQIRLLENPEFPPGIEPNGREGSQLKEYLSTMKIGLKNNQGRGGPLLRRLLKNYFRWKTEISKMRKTDPQKRYQRGLQPYNKRRRIRGGASGGTSSSNFIRNNSADIIEEEAREIAHLYVSINEEETFSNHNNDVLMTSYIDVDDEFDAKAFSKYFGLVPLESLILIRPILGDDDDKMLQAIKPRYVIMYHPDQGFIRRLEVFKARNPELSCKVYFMIYENSVEEQRYLSSIRREKEAFEKLIREKSMMVIPLGRSIPTSRNINDLLSLNSVNTRIAGGGNIDNNSLVIIDVREFRCSLPSLLNARGIEVLPCTLQIGDYILSPNICVERKSISDLFSSFISGRLYTQCEAMVMYYKKPILLIEFEENKSFSLQALSDLRTEIGMNDISSKLALLTLTFPQLKIIWSSSPYATVDIFEDLKQLEDEPDQEKAQSIGLDDNEEINSIYNISPQDFLRALPGITTRNYKTVMAKVHNLKELSQMSLVELQVLIGKDNGKTLYEFFKKDATLID
ncbi:19747_t:CDS:10 [Entrophospora sp. SA101]|nr:19747_t:CDS:10 [Entrophospora sp. SA101]CAJ0831407.1 13954_t:CDS:10 [Entrophospora sp. SA101]